MQDDAFTIAGAKPIQELPFREKVDSSNDYTYFRAISHKENSFAAGLVLHFLENLVIESAEKKPVVEEFADV